MTRTGKDGAAKRPSFSQELRALAGQFSERPAQLGELLEATQGRGFELLLVCITLPFLTPIPLPGFSIPFGIVVAIIGARLALGEKPWLPQRVLQRELPPRFIANLLRGTSRIVQGLELFLRPRLTFMNEHFVFRRLAGCMIALSGMVMLLPLMLPFSNSLPAWTVLLLAAGSLERDGLFFIAGSLSFLLTFAYFTLVIIGGAHAMESVRQFIAT
jgi:hypothetical protein